MKFDKNLSAGEIRYEQFIQFLESDDQEEQGHAAFQVSFSGTVVVGVVATVGVVGTVGVVAIVAIIASTVAIFHSSCSKCSIRCS